MNNSLPDILTLRNNIEFASISQFFHTFQSAFRPWPVTNHDLVYSRNMEANDYVFETEVIIHFYFPLSSTLTMATSFIIVQRFFFFFA